MLRISDNNAGCDQIDLWNNSKNVAIGIGSVAEPDIGNGDVVAFVGFYAGSLPYQGIGYAIGIVIPMDIFYRHRFTMLVRDGDGCRIKIHNFVAEHVGVDGNC